MQIGIFKIYFYLLLLVYMCWIVYVCVSLTLCQQARAWHCTQAKVRRTTLWGSLLPPLPEFWGSNSCQGQACPARIHWAISLVWEMFYIQWPIWFWHQIKNASNAGSLERVLGARRKPILNRLQLCVNEIAKREKWKASVVEAFQASLLNRTSFALYECI